MFAESHPLVRRFIRFLLLPYCFFKLVNWEECKRSRILVALDLLDLFIFHKTFPDHYGPCRLWEIEREKWPFYYGSSYHPYQRARLRVKVQPYDYQILFNDKFVCESLCKGLDVKLPDSLHYLETDGDYREKIKACFEEYRDQAYIIKPLLGHAGRGIRVAVRNENGIQIKTANQLTHIDDFVLDENAIIQRLVKQDKRISSISKYSVNTVRVVTLYTKSETVLVVSATMRFSVGESFIDNWSAGGVAVGVHLGNGKLKKYAFSKTGVRFTRHPLSGIQFENFQVPEWHKILSLAVSVQKSFPFYRLIGMDIAVNDHQEPILIEVNANPDLIFQEQTSGPLLDDQKVLAAFAEYDLLVNKHQKNLLKKGSSC